MILLFINSLENFRKLRSLNKSERTWQHTRKMNRVIAVHSTFSLNWICGEEIQRVGITKAPQKQAKQKADVIKLHTLLSGFWISGKTAQNGFITSRNLTEKEKKCTYVYCCHA